MANFALTGIARSGSSLAAGLISGQNNTYCMNETYHNAAYINGLLDITREFLINGEAIPEKYNDYTLKLNTSSIKNTKIRFRRINKEFDEEANVGVKVTLPFLSRIQWLNDNIQTLAILRNPVYTIGSWHRRDLGFKLIMPYNMSARFYHIPMVATTVIERQAELWDYYATMLWKLRKRFSIMKYEDLVENPKEALSKLLAPLGVQNIKVPVQVKNLNQDSRYKENVDLDLVREAVRKYSPIARKWGYEM